MSGHWHYQLMRHEEDPHDVWYGVHEMFPSLEEGAWTEEPVRVLGESLDDIKWQLETILKDLPNYNPQGLVRINKECRNSKSAGGDTVRGETANSLGKGSLRTGGASYVQEFTNYPRQTLEFPHDYVDRFHPTQKPVALMEYLIKTYTNEGETVLDFTMGSGTTGVACKNLDRNFIGIEIDKEYFQIASKRINEV